MSKCSRQPCLNTHTEYVLYSIQNIQNSNTLLAIDVKIKHIHGHRTRSLNSEISELTGRQSNAGSTGLSSLYPISWLIMEDKQKRLICWTSVSGNDAHSLRYHNAV